MTTVAERQDEEQPPLPRSRWRTLAIPDRYREWAGIAAVTVTVAASYIVFAAWQWSQFTVKSWDLSIFAQLLSRYAALQPPIVTVKGDGFNLLGDHFHPLLALFAPIYAIFPHAFSLLVIQALCFAVAAGIFTRAAQRRLGPAVGVLLGLAFGLSWGLQYAAEAQFHEIAVAVPLLTASLTAVLEKRWRAAALWAALLVFVKEDLGLTVVAIGVLIAFQARKPLGLWLAAWGFGWFALTTLVILPALNPNGAWAYADKANPGAVLSDLAALFDPAKAETLLLLAVITGGLIVRSPIALVLVPTLAWRFMSTNHGYWGPDWHYSAVLMPIAFVALLDAIERGRGSRWAWLRRYSGHGAVIAITSALLLQPGLPLGTILSPASWAAPDRAAAATSVLDAVPAGASVETDVGLMSYLVDDHDVYWIGNTNPTPDCILIDPVAGGTPGEWGDVLAVAARLHPATMYAPTYRDNGYELACRTEYRAG
ncbi:DUF2079 domain-containing protein [Salinibacterium sp. ZJ454]|uniref:DUF2079 domain-containing protein n=1 Tax=Salinibacterium sp. ZJ454 TaxID=2708339 RepID=UPI001421F1DA|nr:DUF2079 domain-containing protein [Salinibacterium sp. ZJ454]